MKKFILLDHEPWTLSRKQLFFDLFEKAGIQLEVWDLSQWLHSGLHNPDEIEKASYLSKFSCLKDFENHVAKLDCANTIVVEEVYRNWPNRQVFRILSKYKIPTIKIDLYANSTIPSSWMSRIKRISISSIFTIIKNRSKIIMFELYKSIYGIMPPIRYFSSNSNSGRTTAINHPDYEKFKFYPEPKLIEDKYIVFCDIYFPYHPDLVYFYRLKKIPNGKRYQQTLINFFDYLEEKYKMPVVVASHPKANYVGNEFGKRRIIKYKTDNLVAGASMVILHLCNTISYALLNDKPVAFIATNEYLSIDHIRRFFPRLATETFDQKIFNLDIEDWDKIKFKRANRDTRTSYIYNYLTSPSTEDVENSQILFNELSKL